MTEIARYFDDYNPDLLPLIPPDAKAILEIGCGAGRLCEAYQRINPGAQWYGVEPNEEAVKIATTRGIEIFDDHVEEYIDWNPRKETFDCLILGDVLEHLQDPWKVLSGLVPLIKPGGQVIASIPNVQHYSVILALLRGRWQYGPEGLLDWTHLRFFTLHSIKAMFEKAGLDIFEIRGRQIDSGELGDWQEVLKRITVPDLATQSSVYQYLVRSVRPTLNPVPGDGEICVLEKAPIPRLHIHTIGDGTICERPRLHEPAVMLATIPGVKCTHSQSYMGIIQDLGHVPDILIQQRFRMFDLAFQVNLAEAGCLIIAEIDDDPEALEGLHHCDFMPLRAVHAIQTTTEVMAETCQRWNPNVAVFPNQVAELPPPREYRNEPPVIFYGSLHREKDWEPIMPALNRVLADHPEVGFVVVADRVFYDALTCPLKLFRPFCPWPEYRSILRTCDIAIVPLEDTQFNRHKSDIKFLECASEGVAVLASKIACLAIPDHKPLVFEYTNPQMFELNLRQLIADRSPFSQSVRRDLAGAAYTYVRDHRLLSQHYRHRHDVYTHWLSQRGELHRALLERVPSLRPRSARLVPV